MKRDPNGNRKLQRGPLSSLPARRIGRIVRFLTALTLVMVVIGLTRASGQDRLDNPSRFRQGVAADHHRIGPAIDLTPSARTQRVESGWLYVVDSNDLRLEAQILVVDPGEGTVAKTFKTGYHPDIALSPDGAFLYLASSLVSADGSATGQLEVIDTASGLVLNRVDYPHRWTGTSPRYFSNLALSADGRWLYAYHHQETDEGDVFFVTTYDTQQGRFLPERALLPGCDAAIMLPLRKARELNVVCASTGDVRYLKLAESGSAISYSKLPLKYRSGGRHGQFVGPVALMPSRNDVQVIMGDGRYYHIDTETQRVRSSDAVDSAARKERVKSTMSANKGGEDWLAGRWMRFQPAIVSPDNGKSFVGLGRLEDLRNGQQTFDQVLVLDAQTLSRLNLIDLGQPVNHITLSKDGRSLYGLTIGGKLLVVDTASRQVVRTIDHVGVSPAFELLAP